LVQLLLQGPMMHGYRANLRTTARIAELIGHEFGVQYHRDHVGRLMHSLNWSPQKPEPRALERNDEAIERWKQKHWPRTKKTSSSWIILPPIRGNPYDKIYDDIPGCTSSTFPAYVPELNPDEGVWALAKRVLANSCPDSTHKLRGCIAQSELLFFLR
jgi:hypothetical protein